LLLLLHPGLHLMKNLMKNLMKKNLMKNLVVVVRELLVVVQELLNLPVVLPMEMVFAALLKFLPQRVRLQNLHRNRNRSFLVGLRHRGQNRFRWGWRSNR